jgi:hypothetical protein
MHLIGTRKELVEEHPWLAMAVSKACSKADALKLRRRAGLLLECNAAPSHPLIPSHGPTQLLGQGDDRARNVVAHRLGTMSGKCGSVLQVRLLAMAGHAWQVQQ